MFTAVDKKLPTNSPQLTLYKSIIIHASQGYSSVPAVPSGLQPYGALALARPGNYLADTQEVSQAKQEFMGAFRCPRVD